MRTGQSMRKITKALMIVATGGLLLQTTGCDMNSVLAAYGLSSVLSTLLTVAT